MNFKKLAATILFVCLFLSINQYAHSQNMLEQMKALHLQKKQGSITAQEFEEKKKAIVESHSPEAKKRADEEAEVNRVKTEKKKLVAEQKKIEEQKVREEEKAIAAKNYKEKFPLHFFVKSKNRSELLKLLKAGNSQINQFDDCGLTAWDLAYKIEDTTTSFDFCKLLKDAGGVSASEIKEFELKKAQAEYVTLKINAGVTYKLGGYQPFVGQVINIIRLNEGEKFDALALSNIPDSAIQATTDNQGLAVVVVPPGDYVVAFAGRLRSSEKAWWRFQVTCTEKITEIYLENYAPIVIPSIF